MPVQEVVLEPDTSYRLIQVFVVAAVIALVCAGYVFAKRVLQ